MSNRLDQFNRPLSDDGHWAWDGAQWVPALQPPVAAQSLAETMVQPVTVAPVAVQPEQAEQPVQEYTEQFAAPLTTNSFNDGFAAPAQQATTGSTIATAEPATFPGAPTYDEFAAARTAHEKEVVFDDDPTFALTKSGKSARGRNGAPVAMRDVVVGGFASAFALWGGLAIFFLVGSLVILAGTLDTTGDFYAFFSSIGRAFKVGAYVALIGGIVGASLPLVVLRTRLPFLGGAAAAVTTYAVLWIVNKVSDAFSGPLNAFEGSDSGGGSLSAGVFFLAAFILIVTTLIPAAIAGAWTAQMRSDD